MRLAGLIALATASVAPPAAADWSKSYVLTRQEHAFYFPGAPTGEAPGADCPAGANPAVDRRKVLKTSYRSWAEVDKILDPESPSYGRNGGLRGPKGENVYDEPWAAPDPGTMPEVRSSKSYGFDLDGDATTGFEGLDGSRGVDNEYYRIAGCMLAYRGAPGTTNAFATEYMLNGAFSVVVVLSGPGDDPRNEPDARLAYYLSADDLVKDAGGAAAADYTYRADPDPRFQSVLKAKIVNGVVTDTGPQLIELHDQVQAAFFPPQLALHRGRFRFEMKDNGALSGVIAGYRATADYFIGWSDAGGIHESVSRADIPAIWYALRRRADYKIDASAPFNDAISTAYRQEFIPAFVTEADGKTLVTQARPLKGDINEAWSRRPGRERKPEWRY